MKRNSKYQINENFFTQIDDWNEKQAYFFGWIGSDAHHDVKRGKLQLRLKESDKPILEILKNCIHYTGPLYYEKRNTLGKIIIDNKAKASNRWGLCFTNKQISTDLTNLGITNLKSNDLRFPSFLKESLISHYLRSYYEGDGTISYSYDCNHMTRLRFEIHLIGQLDFLIEVEKILKAQINVKTYIIKDPKCSNNSHILKFHGNLSSLKFFNYIYKDAHFLLRRKFKKFLRLINYMKKHIYKRKIEETNQELQKAIQLAKQLIQTAEY